jgi:hypothetical protein
VQDISLLHFAGIMADLAETAGLFAPVESANRANRIKFPVISLINRELGAEQVRTALRPQPPSLCSAGNIQTPKFSAVYFGRLARGVVGMSIKWIELARRKWRLGRPVSGQ